MTAHPRPQRQRALRILVATDAWHPQVNGVVHTYDQVMRCGSDIGVEFVFLTPEGRWSLPLPTYREIRLAGISARQAGQEVAECGADFVHVATEGPVGLATRRAMLRAGRPFTTSYHTRFPEYLAARLPLPAALPLKLGYAFERWFHRAGCGVLVATPTLADELALQGFANIGLWSRGVDTDVFQPKKERIFGSGEPVFLYVGRVAVEKNIEAFLSLRLPGRKVVVGGGPQRAQLSRRYPDTLFTGPKYGAELVACYASADVFVFPSRTDTFGNVMLEALACGVPVAAYPVMGPIDVITSPAVGALNEDLGTAIHAALSLDRAACRSFAERHSWRACAERFVELLRTANAAAGHAPLAVASP